MGLADSNPDKRLLVGRAEWDAIERRLDALCDENAQLRRELAQAHDELTQAHANIDQLLAELK